MSEQALDSEARELLQRVLEVFSNDSEELVGEHKLVGFDLEKFRTWFREDGSDPYMIEGYEVGENDIDFIGAYLSEQVAFDFEKFSYFVAAYLETDDWVRIYGKK